MLEVALHYAARPEVGKAAEGLAARYPKSFYLATLHRAENTDEPERLREIVTALSRASARYPVVMPIHPRTRRALERFGIRADGIELSDPVGYFDMLAMTRSCRAVLTDSGGLQKEAYFFGRPCVTFRDETEWTELVDAGCNRVVGADSALILEALSAIEAAGARIAAGPTLYGKGDAAARIVNLLLDRA